DGGGDAQGRDRGGRHRFHPDRPPDAGAALVEDAAVAGAALLADRLGGGVGEVLGPDDQLLRAARGERVGDVDVEPVVTAAVGGDLGAVHVRPGVVVDRAEVQLEPVAAADLPAGRDGE